MKKNTKKKNRGYKGHPSLPASTTLEITPPRHIYSNKFSNPKEYTCSIYDFIN